MRIKRNLWQIPLFVLLVMAAGPSCDGDSPTDPTSTTEYFSFGDELSASPQGLHTGVSTDLSIAARIDAEQGWEITELRIYHVSMAGDSIELLGYAYDNGDLVNNDEIDGDGIFTGLLTGLEYDTPQTIHLRLLAIGDNDDRSVRQAWSEIIELPVADTVTQDHLDEVDEFLDRIEDDYADFIDGGMNDDDAKDALATWMGTQDGVSEAYVSPDGATVWAVYDDGLTVGAYLPAEDDGEAVFGAPIRHESRTDHPDRRVGTPPAADGRIPFGDRDDDDPDEVHSNLAMVLSPFHSWIETLGGGTVEDPSDDVFTLFQESHCPDFTTTYLMDAGADVAAFAGLASYGAISIVTHGTLLAGGEVCLMTGELATLSSELEWFWDLYGPFPTMVLLRHGGKDHLSVKASFISKYNTSFPNSMVYVCACQGMKNSTLEQAFRTRGAGYVTGYDETVSVTYANGVTYDFWWNVVNFFDTSGEAHDAISPQTDPHSHHANFVDFGNRDLHFSGDLKNGDFELGSLAGWGQLGDGRVVTQLGSDSPIEGAHMGIISTGLGFTTSSGEIKQTICLPFDVDELVLDWNFFSEEFLEFCGSVYQDYFQVSITPEGGIETALFYIQIDSMCGWALQPAGVVFDVGPNGDDEGVYKTGWQHLALDLSSYAGDKVLLRLSAGDVGDSSYDSAILLDNIEITSTEP